MNLSCICPLISLINSHEKTLICVRKKKRKKFYASVIVKVVGHVHFYEAKKKRAEHEKGNHKCGKHAN